MPDQSQFNFLNIAVHSLEQEGSRLRDLVKSGTDGPFQTKSPTIESKFSILVEDLVTKIEAVKTAIAEEHVEEAWAAYVELKSKMIPNITSELLSVLGGLYVQFQHLDNICKPLEKITEQDLYFSAKAEELLDDLKGRSDWQWSSVLIVGEERFGHYEAEIIRLRYPACDLWNLPFSAHEYGNLVAHSERQEELNDFKILRHRVANIFSLEDFVEVLPYESCLLDEVQTHWNAYRVLGPTDRKTYVEKNKTALDALMIRQTDHLCRLFADAFATLLLGPAYLHALLHLAFVPNETLYTPTQAMPSFAQRFVIALETLSWMNREPPANIRLKIGDLPFGDEIQTRMEKEKKEIRTGIFPECWKAALASAGLEDQDPYDEIKADLEPWLSQIKKAFRESKRYSSEITIGKTYQRWRIAKLIVDDLLSANRGSIVLKIEDARYARENLLGVILNAAWSACCKNPDQMPLIEEKAIAILLNSVKIEGQAIKPRDEDRLNNPKEAASTSPKPLLDEISRALAIARSYELKETFDRLVSQGQWQTIDDRLGGRILGDIYDNSAALKAYSTLFPKK